MTLAHVGYVAAVLLAAACLAVVGLLVLTRVSKDSAERRRLSLRAPVWQHVLALTTGEDDEVEQARAALLALGPAGRAAVEEDAFALVPKLRGSARTRLRDVLRSWGSVDLAVRNAASRSAVRRCRGLHRLGVLAEGDRRADVLAGLDDRDFAVRRTAVLALGSFPDEDVVRGLLAHTTVEPRLRRDFLASIDRIGTVAVPVLRAELTRSLRQDRAEDGSDEAARRGYLAAEALGLVGAIQAVPELEAALEGPSLELKIACIDALGDLGAASSVVALAGPLGHTDPDVRRAAARAIGLVGGPWGVPALNDVLYDDNVEVARAAANALRRCGVTGVEVLAASDAPVAREVLALSALAVG
jgi:HEAT repeat protein